MTFAAATLYFFFGFSYIFFGFFWALLCFFFFTLATYGKFNHHYHHYRKRWRGKVGGCWWRGGWKVGAGGCRHVWAIVIASQLLAAHHITQLTKDRYEKCNSKIQRCTGENNRREEAGSRFWENFYLIEKAY